MKQAGKSAFSALFIAFLMVGFSQPSSCAAASTLATPIGTLSILNSFLPQANIASFEDKSNLLTNLNSDLLLANKNLAAYGSAGLSAVLSKQDAAPIKEVSASNLKVLHAVSEAAIEVKTASLTNQPQVSSEAIVSATYGLNADVLLDLVNNYRVSIGLKALDKDGRVMQVALERVPELFDEIFVNGNMHAGFYARNLPYHSTENIIYNNTEQGAFQWWLNSPIHRHAIENPTYTHTGIACGGKFCSQIFASL